MNILVINSGSSSLKYQLIDDKSGELLKKGTVECIGEKDSPCPNHKAAVKEVFKELKGDNTKIAAVGHRVVHGGEAFKQSVVVTTEVLEKLEKISHLAPLHNPANLMGVRACMDLMPDTPNVLVFDTAFHSTMPASAYMYAIPADDYKKHGIRRYGFHGTSHNYVSRKCAELYGKPREDLRIITIHLGGGCSICAIDKGRSVDTSMGLTPLEGLVMDSRCGDIDAAVVQSLAKAHNFTIDQTINYLNKESGMKGLGGLGPDFRANMEVRETNPQMQTAFDVYMHRLVKYIGAYMGVMGGVDAIAWTGGVGSNQMYIRDRVMSHFEYAGAMVDPDKNNYFGYPNLFQTGEISAKNSKVRTFVIKTDEEFEIAQETARLVK